MWVPFILDVKITIVEGSRGLILEYIMKKDIFYGVALSVFGALSLYASANVAIEACNALALFSPFKPSYTVVYISISLSVVSIAIIYLGMKRVMTHFR